MSRIASPYPGANHVAPPAAKDEKEYRIFFFTSALSSRNCSVQYSKTSFLVPPRLTSSCQPCVFPPECRHYGAHNLTRSIAQLHNDRRRFLVPVLLPAQAARLQDASPERIQHRRGARKRGKERAHLARELFA